jgi:aerobic carbon-monoxide dehydrogenase small subunit
LSSVCAGIFKNKKKSKFVVGFWERRCIREPEQAWRKLDAHPRWQLIFKLMKRTIRLTINEEAFDAEVEPRLLLSYFLRERAGLTGTHIGCVIGECGACTVLLDGRLVKSCLLFAVQADGRKVLTIEGLAKNGALHAIQEAFVQQHGLQCGYCTPGMVLATYSLLRDNRHPTEEEIRKALGGNLCMCTGYVQIVESVKAAAKNFQQIF